MSCGFPRQRNIYNTAVVQEKTSSRQTNFWFVVVLRADSVTFWCQKWDPNAHALIESALRRFSFVFLSVPCRVKSRCNSVFVPPPPPRVNVHRRTNSRANLCTIRENEHHGAHFRGVRPRVFVPPAKMCTMQID